VTPAPDRSISVIRLRTSLEGSVTCARELRRLSNYLPVEGSQAASELEEGAELADEWAPNPLDQALMIASVHLAAADDCMNALGVLLAKDVVYSPFVIVRSVLETAARGWHILDPDIGMRERVARGMTERLYGLSEIGRMGKQFAERARTDRVPKIIESAERQGFTPIPPRKKWEPYAIDSPRPGMMESIEALIVHHGDPGLGRLMARYTSGIAHGTASALYQLLEKYPDPSDSQRALGAPELGLKTMVPFVATTLIGSIRATERQVILYGWDWAMWDSWQRSALRTCTDLINANSSPS
jgi:hypothetical protein